MDRFEPGGVRDARIFPCITWLGRAGWLVLVVALVAHPRERAAGQAFLTASLTAFFVLLLARVVLQAMAEQRRRAHVVLTASILCWAAGSFFVNATSISDLTRFPAPGEWLFLLAYAGFVGYLILDGTRPFERPLTRWLDVIVICGGTTCVASSLLLTPVAVASGERGAPLLLALLYPIADLALAVLVLAQVVLRARPDSRSALILILGFVTLAGADSGFVLQVTSSTYQFSALNDGAWGLAFMLIVSAACRPRTTVLRAVPRVQGSMAVLVAGTAAVVVLTFSRNDTLGPYVAAVAVITLLAAGTRMAVALKQANRAAEAFALSETDDLTKLPNRRAVRQRLERAITGGQPHALLLLDLDGFKEINDTLGHAAGDTVLQLTAVRMRDCLAADVMVARLGGDEFAILMQSEDEIGLLETANDVLTELQKPIVVDGIEVAPSASIGIATSLTDDSAGSDLLRRADVAMYQAKSNRRGAAIYDAHADEFSRQRLEVAVNLRKGIAQGQLELYYQPQVDAITREVRGLEALVRWRHPEQGVLSPIAFLPAARRAGLMGALSNAVVALAVRDVHHWRRDGLDVKVALNCAPPELLSGVLMPRLYQHLAEWDVPGDRFVLEVTEDSFLAEPERARSILLDVQDHGLEVAIDDYGTGFSSLTYLRDLPVHELKIDRSFVNGILTDPRSRVIVLSTGQLAHGLGMRSVAEGVEDGAMAAELVTLGIDVLQGYSISAPIPADRVQEWVADWNTVLRLAEDAETLTRRRDQESSHDRDRGRATRIRGGHRPTQPRAHEA